MTDKIRYFIRLVITVFLGKLLPSFLPRALDNCRGEKAQANWARFAKKLPVPNYTSIRSIV